MDNIKQIDCLVRIADALRGSVETNNIVPALYIISELRRKFDANQEGLEYLWQHVTDLTYELKLAPVFESKESFFRIYGYLRNDIDFANIDYEMLLALNFRILGKNFVRFGVSDALFQLLSEKAQKLHGRILIAEGEKFVPYLQKIVNQNNDNFYTITVSKQFEFEVIRNIFAHHSNVKVDLARIYDYEFLNQNFDGIISIPNFGANLMEFERHNFMCRESEFIALENLLLHLSLQGRLIILLPPRISFGVGRIKELRNFIQHSYGIEDISELPEGVLANTNLKTYLYTFTKDFQDEILIKKYKFAEKEQNIVKKFSSELKVSDETFVMLSELEEQGDWNVDKIFTTQDSDWQKYHNSNTKKLFLKDVADVFRGKAITEKDPRGRIGVINISNIQEYNIDYDGLDYIDDEERKVSKYLLKEGDLLLPVRGTAIKSAVFHQQPYPCIASANIIVIRPYPRQISATYLKLFFDSDIGKKILKSIQQGATIINISYKDLQYIEIPCLPYDEQMEISEKYNQALAIYQKTIEEAQKQWNSVVTNLQKKLEE